ncbi:flavin-containing monooxygenase [Nocardioides sp. NPDC051685]|uniref:flavin-containing monooxygenase n=1 Tax=Nocardioides sp. NPDC051685 TaxID=3364334 RepID=UPI0037AB209A
MSENEYVAGAEHWLRDLEKALSSQNRDSLEGLFVDPSYLRDNGALTWDFLQYHGRDAVVTTLLATQDEIQPHGFVLSRRWPAPRVVGEGQEARLEVFADFQTKHGLATAFVHASLNENSPHGFDVFAVFTRLEGIKGHEPSERYPRGIGFEPSRPDENWLDRQAALLEYRDRDPEVLIIGGGQAGLITAAHLKNLGVDALVVEKNERVGDNWRKRYESLFLHNPIEMNDFPFLDFPGHYPEYLPKDAMAEWLELYQRYLNLNVWLSTEFVGAQYDEQTHSWTAAIRRGDQAERVLRPKHIVHCTGGFGGRLRFPDLPGLSDFQGTIIHSEQYRRAADYEAKRAVVLGVATSGHDVAEDLYRNGVDVTLVQRGPIVVSNLETANELVYAGFLDPNQPTELVDVRYGMGWIYPLRVENARKSHQLMVQKDAEMLRGLEQAGMKLWDGPNGMGWLGLYWSRGGGYYLNKGASELIASGQIGLMQAEQIVKVVPDGLELADGRVVEADLLVCATGYENRVIELSDQFGEEAAAKLGQIAVLDETGEWRGFWGQSGQRGLWINGGGINSARPQSERMALLIKADLAGFIPDSFRRPPRQEQDRRFASVPALASQSSSGEVPPHLRDVLGKRVDIAPTAPF